MGKYEPPKEAQAPAYFIQYAALWCIMLAFFVMMLSLGKEKTAEFKRGIGLVKDGFGVGGGQGSLPYWFEGLFGSRLVYPKTEEEDESGDVVGYVKGMLWKEGLSSMKVLRVDIESWGTGILLQSPLRFHPGDAGIDLEGRKFLDKIGGIFFNLEKWHINVQCLTHEDQSEDGNLFLASRRASAVWRYLNEECYIEPARLDATGYSSGRYLNITGQTDVAQNMLFYLRQVK